DSHKFKIYLPRQISVENLCGHSEKIWQCCPVNFYLPASLTDIIMQVIFFFKNDLFRSLLIALFLSFFTLMISLLSGYLFCRIHLLNNSFNNYIIYLSFFTFILSSILLSFIS